jgi:cytochrome c peroxidase
MLSESGVLAGLGRMRPEEALEGLDRHYSGRFRPRQALDGHQRKPEAQAVSPLLFVIQVPLEQAAQEVSESLKDC